jgi:hypothetical protein
LITYIKRKRNKKSFSSRSPRGFWIREGSTRILKILRKVVGELTVEDKAGNVTDNVEKRAKNEISFKGVAKY